MSRIGASIVLCVTILCMVIGIAGVIVGAVGNSWWTDDSTDPKTVNGLWKDCRPAPISNVELCLTRKNILKFDEDLDAREKDAILLALIIGASFGFFSLIAAISIGICSRGKRDVNMAALLATLLAFIASMASLGAVIYAEAQFDKTWDLVDHGWAVILAWIGALALFISFILSFTLICLTSSDKHESYSSSYNNNRSHNNMADRSVNGQANQGYELQ